MLVQVYRNLKVPGEKVAYSIVDVSTGRVVDIRTRVLLRDVEFRVQPAGVFRVRQEGKKNVHAKIWGELFEAEVPPLGPWIDIYYNPKEVETFVLRHDKKTPVFRASWVLLDGTGIHAVNPSGEALGHMYRRRSNPLSLVGGKAYFVVAKHAYVMEAVTDIISEASLAKARELGGELSYERVDPENHLFVTEHRFPTLSRAESFFEWASARYPMADIQIETDD